MATPYFYIIKHLPTNKYYAGCKINFRADPSDFMTKHGYKTTSKIVKSLIERDGLDSFSVLKIRVFEKPEDALRYETRFLQKVNAAENEAFLNRQNGGRNFVNKGGYKLTEATKNKMRKPKSAITIQRQNEAKKRRTKETYLKIASSRRNNGKPWFSQETKEMIKKHNALYWSDENREKHRDTMVEYYKKNPISEETRRKLSAKNRGSKNRMFGKKHSEETRAKMKAAWQERKIKNKNK